MPKMQNSPCWLALVGLAGAFIAFIVVPRLSGDVPVQFLDSGVLDDEQLGLFVDYDKNMNGQIDMEEFVPLANSLLKERGTEKWDESGEHLSLKASFTPLLLSSMSNVGQLGLKGLKSWQMPSQPVSQFPVSAFASFFLPPEKSEVEPGHVWYLVKPVATKYDPDPSSNRYFPPAVHGSVVILHRLLAMFHPRPFVLTRFGPQGSLACIRAQNHQYFDISFRVHAEFQLNRPPLLPFWFTPGQFSGNVIIRKDGTHIESFQMVVPNNRTLNVDMEWLVDNRQENEDSEKKEDQGPPDFNVNNEVDIGYLPEMALCSTEPSSLPRNLENNPTATQEPKADNFQWDSQISVEEARRIMEQKFYPFKKVPYLRFEEAFKRAQREDKLVHHILLWGVLDDQSC